jgi:hypothetical protein
VAGRGLLCFQGRGFRSFRNTGIIGSPSSNCCSERPSFLSCTVERRGCLGVGRCAPGDRESPRAIVASGSVSNGIVEQQESGKRGLWSTLCKLRTLRETIETAECPAPSAAVSTLPKSSRDRT